VQRGTAAQARSLGRPLGGKTGTTSEFRSAWFVGFSPDIVVGVFVGFDDNRSLGDKETGAVDAVPIFIDFMRDALQNQPPEDFKAPPGAKLISVHGNVEAFRPGTEPKVQVIAAPEASFGGPPPAPGAPAPPTPLAPPPPPPPKKAPADLSGLY